MPRVKQTENRDERWAKATFELDPDVFKRFQAICTEQGLSPKRMAQLALYMVVHLDDGLRAEAMRMMSGRQTMQIAISQADKRK